MLEILLAVATLCEMKSMGLTGYESSAREAQYKCQTELVKCAESGKYLGGYELRLFKCVAERKIK